MCGSRKSKANEEEYWIRIADETQEGGDGCAFPLFLPPRLVPAEREKIISPEGGASYLSNSPPVGGFSFASRSYRKRESQHARIDADCEEAFRKSKDQTRHRH